MDAPGVNGGSMCICVDMLEMEETIKPRNFRISAEPSCTIYEVKNKIQESEGIPPCRQRLFFGEQPLEDGRILSDYGSPIRNLSLLHAQNDHGETIRASNAITEFLRLHLGPGLDELRRSIQARPELLRQRCLDSRDLPLHAALDGTWSQDVVQLLVNVWSRAVREAGDGGSLPMHRAAARCSLETVKCLWEEWSWALRVRDEMGELPLHKAAAYNPSLEVAQFLYDAYPESLNEKSDDGSLPLQRATSANNSLEVVEFLTNATREALIPTPLENAGKEKDLSLRRCSSLLERVDRTEPTKATPVSGSVVSEPGEKDIICGPAGLSNGHVGNHVYRAIVELEGPRYRESRTPFEKSAIVARLVEFFRRRESRFLVADSMNRRWMKTAWQELGEQDVVSKVKQSLRDAWKPSDSHLFSQSQADAGPAVEIIEAETNQGASWVVVPAANHEPPPGDRDYLPSDYLLGNHGALTNVHPGNVRFRAEVMARRAEYFACKANQKGAFIEAMMKRWKSQGGRFLKRDAGALRWVEAPHEDVKPVYYRLFNRCKPSDPAAGGKASFCEHEPEQVDYPSLEREGEQDETAATKWLAYVIEPRAIAPAYSPNNNDVLCGRGELASAHSGNVQLRQIVSCRKSAYNSEKASAVERAGIAYSIVWQIRGLSPPGRFLKLGADGCWHDVGDEEAMKKVRQCLREAGANAPEETGAHHDELAPGESLGQFPGAAGVAAHDGGCVPAPPTSGRHLHMTDGVKSGSTLSGLSYASRSFASGTSFGMSSTVQSRVSSMSGVSAILSTLEPGMPGFLSHGSGQLPAPALASSCSLAWRDKVLARACARDLLLVCADYAAGVTSVPPDAESVQVLISVCQGYLDKVHHILTTNAINEAESDEDLSRLCDLLDSAIKMGTEKASALRPRGSERSEALADVIQGQAE